MSAGGLLTGVRLSRRERETFDWLLTGKSEKEIAVALDLSTHTVHQYVKAVYKKVGVHTRAELMARHLGGGGPRARSAAGTTPPAGGEDDGDGEDEDAPAPDRDADAGHERLAPTLGC